MTLRHWRPALLAVASGAALAAAYPGYDVWALAPVGLIPLLTAAAAAPRWQARFRLGWLAGFVFFLSILPWILSLWDWAGGLIAVAYVALCAGLALIWGAWTALALRPARWPWLWMLGAAGGWAALEALKGAGNFGFGWGNLGHALVHSPPLLQVASWTGEAGLSFLVVLLNAALWLSWTRRRAGFALAAVAAVALAGAGGALQQGALNERIERAPRVTLALVQPNIPQREKSDPGNLEQLREKYVRLLDSLQGPLDLVVMPESILPTLLLDDEATQMALFERIAPLGARAVVGSFTRSGTDVYNTAVLFDAAGRFLDSYDKVQLVPFSTEYFPFIDQLNAWFPRLTSLPLGLLSRGEGFSPLTAGQALIGTPICFETSFGRIARAFVANGANLLVSITNDAWFKRSVELEQHWAMGVLRAAETGRAFVQAANTGVSAAALPTGQQLLRLERHVEAVGTVEVPLLTHETLYLRWGEWFVWMAAALATAALASARARVPQS